MGMGKIALMGGCLVIFLAVILIGGPVALGLFAINNLGEKPGGTASTGSASCGVKEAPGIPPIPSGCSFTSKTPSSNGFYRRTSFGCNNGFPKDPYDNCIPACPKLSSVEKASSTPPTPSGTVSLSGLDGPGYESAIEWYSANADEYGCNKKIKVTNPENGKAVIVIAIDRGPSCSVMSSGLKFDISQVGSRAIDSPDIVKVETVPDDTPLGPVTACP